MHIPDKKDCFNFKEEKDKKRPKHGKSRKGLTTNYKQQNEKTKKPKKKKDAKAH